jgi:hypothetical protein
VCVCVSAEVVRLPTCRGTNQALVVSYKVISYVYMHTYMCKALVASPSLTLVMYSSGCSMDISVNMQSCILKSNTCPTCRHTHAHNRPHEHPPYLLGTQGTRT